MDYRTLIVDFIAGGLIVAVAVWVGTAYNPVLGGIIAGAPLRLATSIFLTGWHENERLAYEMAKGSLYAVGGTLFFVIALVYAMPRIGLTNSFGLATVVWCVSTVALYAAERMLLK